MLYLIKFLHVQTKQKYLNCFCKYLFLWFFSILVLLLDKLVLEIDLDLFTVFTVFSVSVIWVDLDLSNDLTLSDLLILGVSIILLDACDFSFLLTLSIFFFSIGGVMSSFTTLSFPPMTVLTSLTAVSVVVTNPFSVSSKYPLFF